MISFLRGTCAMVTSEQVILDVNGVGYGVYVPKTLLDELSDRNKFRGTEMMLYTSLQVKEDSMTLYGFSTPAERELFLLLLMVSGIGPKGALNILSVLPPDKLRFAILSKDEKAISKAPGIGAKTAKKLILELSDRLKIEATDQDPGLGGISPADPDLSSADAGSEASSAVLALTELGFGRTESYQAVRKVLSAEGMEEADAETLIKFALKQLY